MIDLLVPLVTLFLNKIFRVVYGLLFICGELIVELADRFSQLHPLSGEFEASPALDTNPAATPGIFLVFRAVFIDFVVSLADIFLCNGIAAIGHLDLVILSINYESYELILRTMN